MTEAVQQIAVEKTEERVKQIQAEEEARRKAEEERLAAEAARKSAGGRSKTSGSADILRGWKSAL